MTMKPGQHGASVYVVDEADAPGEEIAVFDDLGRLSPGLVRFGTDFKSLEIPDRHDSSLKHSISRPIHYKRYFGASPEADRPSLDLLERLGEAIEFNDFADDTGDVPDAYTYFGQFVFHDMTSMVKGPDPANPENARTAALDLDSVFGTLPDASGSQGDTLAPMTAGETTSGQRRDIPRSATGVPVLADKRNDSNLPLAQVHMALIRFYNAVCRVTDTDDEARRLTQLHFQSVALHDYASRIVDEGVYRDVVMHSRAIVHTGEGPFLVPLEFAAAFARFGHTMVRNRYPWNDLIPRATVHDFWGATYISSANPVTRLPGYWAADWRRLLGIGLQPGELPIFAARIRPRLAFPLKHMSPEALPKENGSKALSANLAVRSLQRGYRLELNSAQEVARRMNAELRRLRRPEFGAIEQGRTRGRGEPAVTRGAHRAAGTPQAAARRLHAPVVLYAQGG